MADVNCGETNFEDTGELKTFERNKYFYGKLMTVRDFETEQRYMNSKRYLLNRLIHGIGLVCGLEVSEPAIVDGKLRVRLEPGVALDCCGHEIVVQSGATYDADGSAVDGVNYVYIKYHECQKEPVPALSNPSSCEEVCCYSRIKEDFKLEVTQQAPPAAMSFDWKQVWQTRKAEILAVADKLGLPAPRDEIEARLVITADEFYQKAACPACDDVRVLLAVIKVTGTSATVDADDILALRAPVYSNPMLHELMRSHLDDVDNPHQTTAEQVKALMSVNNVGNSPSKAWVQNIDIVSADGTITVTPGAAAKKIDIKTDHSQVNPLEVDPTKTDSARDKHVSNADANRWNKSISSVDGLGNPGGDIDLLAGTGIKIDHPAVTAGSPPAIRVSAIGTTDATTGLVKLTIPKAIASGELTRVVNAEPGHVISEDVFHELAVPVPPSIVLGLVTENGIIMKDDFITQYQNIRLLAEAYKMRPPPPVSFTAVALDNKKFNILAVNMDSQAEVTVIIRWWAMAARPLKELPIEKLVDAVREKLGDNIIKAIAEERGITAAQALNVIAYIIEAILAQPPGIKAAELAASVGVKEEIAQEIVSLVTEIQPMKLVVKKPLRTPKPRR